MDRRAEHGLHSLLPAPPSRWRDVVIAAAAVAMLLVAAIMLNWN